MRLAVWMVVLAGLGLVGWHAHRPSPTAAEVEPLLRQYLAHAACVGGEREVERLDTVSLGRYIDSAGGWPVYADHVERCGSGERAVTFDSSADAERQVAAALVRRGTDGRLQLVRPVRDAHDPQQMALTIQQTVAQYRTARGPAT